MKMFLFELNDYGYGDDCALIIMAENKERAKEIACETSEDFKHYMDTPNIKITTISINREQCVLIVTCRQEDGLLPFRHGF
jgi:hypothetical protein